VYFSSVGPLRDGHADDDGVVARQYHQVDQDHWTSAVEAAQRAREASFTDKCGNEKSNLECKMQKRNPK
jgi:hypothetical protein